MTDLKFGLRQMTKHPVFTAVAVITLALGIGANTAVFSVVHAVLLRPLPYGDPDRLAWVWGANPKNGIPHETASAPDFLDWKHQNQVFQDMGAYHGLPAILTGSEEPERFLGAATTPNLLPLLRVPPLMGRLFTDEDAKPGAVRVAILSHGLWQRRFGGDSSILGRTITLNGAPATVVGVMPAGFFLPVQSASRHAEIITPLHLDPERMGRRSDFLGVIARLRDGVTLQAAGTEMEGIAGRLAGQYPATNTNWSTIVLGLHERFFGESRPVLRVLLGAVLFLLLIACANIANLLLARAAARRKELSIRAALGAGRARLIRQLLVESVLLALAGGAAGLGLAAWLLDLVRSLGSPGVPGLESARLDATVLAFTLGVSVLTGVLFGALPALQASGVLVVEALKEGGRGASGAAGGRRMRNGLVVAEIGLAMLLLLGAGLMVRTLMQLNRVDAGFRPEGILTAELGLPAAKYGEPHQRSAFYARLLEEAGAIPGVKAAGAVSDLPLSGGGNYLSFVVEGRPPVPDGVTVDAIATVATPEWFGAMGIPLVRGRLFSGDDGPGRPKTLVINEAMAARHFPGEDPIGRKISFGGDGADSWITIVGVVGDTRNVSLDEPSYPQAYAPYAQIPQRSMVVTLRTDGDPADRAGAFRALVRRLDPDQPVSGVSTMQTRITDSVAQRRFGMMLLSLFAGLALVLASVGIYGVMSYTVSLRTHEIGIRMALGARGGDVLGMLMRTGLALGLAGVAAGLLLAFPLTRTMAGFLYGVSPTDPLTWSLVAAALVGIALAASYVPARRATRVDPNVALRCE